MDAAVSTNQPPGCIGLTYDASRSRVVGVSFVFSLPSFSGQIWEWDGVDWSLRQTLAFPPNGIVYHAAQQVSVLTGWDSVAQVRRTLLWDGVSLTPAAPPPDTFQLMIEDPAHGVVLGMTGGDTWTWDGSQWSQVSQSSVTTQLRVTYDAARQRPIAMGAGTTLEWDGANWNTVLPFPSPPSNTGAGLNLAYDSLRDRVVFAGQGTWEWNGSLWEQRFPLSEPSTRTLTAVAYSSVLGRVVLFGGVRGSPLGDTWLWDGMSWALASPATTPPARYNHALAYDSGRDQVVLFGGYAGGPTSLDDTWEFDGATWTQRLPTTKPVARSRHALAYDPGRRRTVLFGGIALQGRLQDTWEWDGTTWQQRFPASSAPSRDWSGMTYDDSRARIVLFGGRGDSSTEFNDTWEWDGVDWTQRTTANAPTPRYGLALAYDTTRREVICYGGAGSTQDTWRYAPTDPASYTTSQSGCPGSAGTPALTTTSPSGFPWLGDPFAVLVTNAAPGSAVAMAVGLSNAAWAGVPLPLALAFVGMPGCQAYTSAELFSPAGTADPSGTAAWNLGVIPNDPAFLGARFYTQAWIADGVNPAGLVVSDLGEAVAGAK